MQSLFNYIENNQIFFLILLCMLVLIIALLCLCIRQYYNHKKLERSIEEERRFYGSFENETENVYLCIDKADLKVLYTSNNFQTVTGLDKSAVCSDIEVLSALISPYDARKIRKELKNWDQKEPLKYEMDYHKIGSDKIKHAKVSLSYDQSRKIYLFVFSDITNEYTIRNQLKEELKDAQKESLAKTDFLSRMSHEIRTPMNGILGMLNLAQKHIEDTDAVQQYLGKTENLSMFLLTLINDILDMSRI